MHFDVVSCTSNLCFAFQYQALALALTFAKTFFFFKLIFASNGSSNATVVVCGDVMIDKA